MQKNCETLTLLLFLQYCFSPVQERNVRLQGQLTESHRVEERTRNELQACRLKSVAAEKEKNRAEMEKKHAEQKRLEAYNQVDEHKKEAGEMNRQLHEVEVCEGAWLIVITLCDHVLSPSALYNQLMQKEHSTLQDKVSHLEKENRSLHDQLSELEKEQHGLQGKLSELETANMKLQASQRYAEELEAERDDYKRKLSDSHELIVQHLRTQVCPIL